MLHRVGGTPFCALSTRPNEQVAEAIARAQTGRFDYLRVRAHAHAPVVGLLHAKDEVADREASVNRIMRPLSGENFIGTDARLLDFATTTDSGPCTPRARPCQNQGFGDVERPPASSRSDGNPPLINGVRS